MRRFAFAIAVLSVTAAPQAQAQYTTEYVSIGGVDLDRYCAAVHGHRYESVLLGDTAGDWKCQRVGSNHHHGEHSSGRHPISVERACKMQYGRDGLKAKALDWNDPLSWRCMQAYVAREKAPAQQPRPVVRDHREASGTPQGGVNVEPTVRNHRGPTVRDHRQGASGGNTVTQDSRRGRRGGKETKCITPVFLDLC